MSNIISHLSEEINKCISNAKSINVAVALTSSFGVDTLSSKPARCKVKIVTGVDLPTSIDVLKQLRVSYGADARIYLKSDSFFHPKVYIFTLKDNSHVAFIGSGNFTSGGLNDNIELSYKVTDQEECKELLLWFESLYKESSEITDTFLKEYRPYVVKWQGTKKQQMDEMSDIQEYMDTISLNYNAIKNELIKLRASSDYETIVKERGEIVEKLKEAIHYKNNFKGFNVDKFMGIYPLGKIRQAFNPYLKKAVKNGKMQKLCQMLCDDSLPIEERYRLAVTDYKVYGCGCNIITKILCVHKPKEYMLWNSASKEFLKSTGVSFERGTQEWQKYKQLCKIFKKLCVETDIEDFAVLDYLLLIAIDRIKIYK